MSTCLELFVICAHLGNLRFQLPFLVERKLAKGTKAIKSAGPFVAAFPLASVQTRLAFCSVAAGAALSNPQF